METPPPFKLSAQLGGHAADVRAVKFVSKNTILSGSRDCTVRVWSLDSETENAAPKYTPRTIREGSAYVSSLAFVRPRNAHPEGLALSGDMEGLIQACTLDAKPTENATGVLFGHERNVCTLDVAPNGRWFVSGGWDGLAHIWSADRLEITAHLGCDGNSVWAVLAVNERTAAVGGVDKKIRVFDLKNKTAGPRRPSNVIATSDVVRSLCRVPGSNPYGAEIACATNDFLIHLYALDGQHVAALAGHESFVYSIAPLFATGEIVSCGEDRTLRVWRGDECIQTITHPAISVWSVSVCPETGDLVTGSSDGIARVWTRDESRAAPRELLDAYDETLQASAIPHQQVEGLDKDDMPGPEFIQNKSGTKEGQIQTIRESDGSVSAYQWSSSKGWFKVGTVVESTDSGSAPQKSEYNGQLYDYVFDVAIDEEKSRLKLPFNVGDNPRDAATKFIVANELPSTYLEETTRFIIKNTKNGPSRPAPPAGQDGILPWKEYISILSARHEAIVKKICTLNDTLVQAGRDDLVLGPDEISDVKNLQEHFRASFDAPVVEPATLKAVLRMIDLWEGADRLAGLDLLRCMAVSPVVAGYSSPHHGPIVKIAIDAGLAADSKGKISENCTMMAARVVVNLCTTDPGRESVAANLPEVLRFLLHVLGMQAESSVPIAPASHLMQLAVATALVNLSVLACRTDAVGPAQRVQLVKMCGTALEAYGDAPALFHVCAALGTLVSSGTDDIDVDKAALRRLVEGIEARADVEQRTKKVCREIRTMIS